MKLKIVSIGNSHGIIIPRTAMQLFEIKHNDLYKVSFSKSRIILDKIKIEKPNHKPSEKPKEEPKQPKLRIPTT